jgi:hypothetical protein
VPQNNSGNTDQLDQRPETTPNLQQEIASIQESLNQTRTEMSLYRRRVEKRQMEVDAHIHRTNVLWAAMLLVIVGLGTAIAFGIHSGALVVRYPANHAPSDSAQAHVASTAPVEKPIARDHQSEEQQNGSPVQPPPAEPERQAAVNASPNIQSVPPQRSSSGTFAADSIPDRKVNSDNSNSQLLADSVNRNRIDFVVTRNKTVEVAPGIFLTVRNTNVERQQVNGWIQISQDGRTVWLRDQGARKVMTFAKKNDSRSHELIFTRVGKEGVAGYLLVPMTTG